MWGGKMQKKSTEMKKKIDKRGSLAGIEVERKTSVRRRRSLGRTNRSPAYEQ